MLKEFSFPSLIDGWLLITYPNTIFFPSPDICFFCQRKLQKETSWI